MSGVPDDRWQRRVKIPLELNPGPHRSALGRKDAFQQRVDVERLHMRGREKFECRQPIDKTFNAARLLLDDLEEFGLTVHMLALQQLCGANDPAERVLDFVTENATEARDARRRFIHIACGCLAHRNCEPVIIR